MLDVGEGARSANFTPELGQEVKAFDEATGNNQTWFGSFFPPVVFRNNVEPEESCSATCKDPIQVRIFPSSLLKVGGRLASFKIGGH